MTQTKKKRQEPLLRPGMAFIGLDYLDFFGNIITDIDISGTEVEVILTDEFENLY